MRSELVRGSWRLGGVGATSSACGVVGSGLDGIESGGERGFRVEKVKGEREERKEKERKRDKVSRKFFGFQNPNLYSFQFFRT